MPYPHYSDPPLHSWAGETARGCGHWGDFLQQQRRRRGEGIV